MWGGVCVKLPSPKKEPWLEKKRTKTYLPHTPPFCCKRCRPPLLDFCAMATSSQTMRSVCIKKLCDLRGSVHFGEFLRFSQECVSPPPAARAQLLGASDSLLLSGCCRCALLLLTQEMPGTGMSCLFLQYPATVRPSPGYLQPAFTVLKYVLGTFFSRSCLAALMWRTQVKLVFFPGLCIRQLWSCSVVWSLQR